MLFCCWDNDKIPLIRACTVLCKKNLWPYQFVADYYHMTKLQATYAGKVMPTGVKDQWILDGEVEDVKIAPPN